MIGIFLADGKFFPVLDECSGGAKRLVISPVRENQERIVVSVVLRSESEERYLGSLTVESSCNEAIVEMLLRNGTIFTSLSCGDSVSRLKVFLDDSSSYSMPDLDMLSAEEKDALVDEMVVRGDVEDAGDFSEWEDDTVQKSRPWTYWVLLFAGVLLALTACLAIAYLVYVVFLRSEPAPPIVFSSSAFFFPVIVSLLL
ncbi:hypothetical protein WKV44_07490 [Spirochaetia bacterium 38H-sp]|uniref:Transmembrane protein n=1 Tax=Rarispira pelagica TaxID=3141764 RepID=A0ABU9UEI8_9SPIR